MGRISIDGIAILATAALSMCPSPRRRSGGASDGSVGENSVTSWNSFVESASVENGSKGSILVPPPRVAMGLYQVRLSEEASMREALRGFRKRPGKYHCGDVDLLMAF